MTIHDSLLNRIERLAKHIGRTDEIVARLQQQEYDLRHARDGAVRELQQVKADRDDIESKRKVLHEAITEMFAELSAAAATFWPDHDPGTVAIPKLTGEIGRLRAEIDTLRKQLDAAQREASDEFAERQVLQHEASDDYVELARLRAFVKLARGLITKPYADVYKLREALAELDAGTTEPTPVAEPTPCPECERLQLAMNDSDERITNLMSFVEKVRPLIDMPRRPMYPRDIDFVRAALAALDAGTTEPTPVAEPAPCHELEPLRRFVGGVEGALSAFQSISPDTCCDQIARYLSELEDSQPTPVAEPLEAEGGK